VRLVGYWKEINTECLKYENKIINNLTVVD